MEEGSKSVPQIEQAVEHASAAAGPAAERKPTLLQFDHSQGERIFNEQRAAPAASKAEDRKKETPKDDAAKLTRIPNHNPVSPRSRPKEILLREEDIYNLDYHAFLYSRSEFSLNPNNKPCLQPTQSEMEATPKARSNQWQI
ncbi:hypothetical protein H2198_002365 [Neophaeococcomyces mojaviensis]|uniref:Uncharacterized protein n=1 Tax=Neophaeococcomyces mojaviensis TaxID=3383035 RepID=A0ACC3AEH7_9EURO|nr:hypothetical protein H2198_002365 [Knufia sp. JES_112]